MAIVVVLTKSGIEANSNKFFYQILGDPSQGLGLPAAVGSIAMQDDSAPKGQLWEKTTTSDTGWVLIVSASSAGGSSASGAFRASAYNVPVDGSDPTTAWTALMATIPATGGPYTVVLGPTEVLGFTADTTIPARVRVQGFGGVIKPASGKKVTLMAQPESAGQLFDTSAGGTVVAGVPMTVKPEWWGAWATGAADATVDAPASIAAFKALVPTGGTLHLAQQYKVATNLDFSLIDHANITIEAGVTGAGWYHTVDASDLGTSLVQIQGTTAHSVTNLTLRGVTFSGHGSTDAQKALFLGNLDGVLLERCRFLNVGKEGCYFQSASSVKNVTVRDCYAENVGVATNLSAFNLNATNALITGSRSLNCGMFTEQTGSNFRMIGNQSEQAGFHHAIVASTWSADFGQTTASTETDYSTAVIANNMFFGGPGLAIYMPDVAGHTDNGHVVHGNAGKFLITGNNAIGCGGFFNGGADQLQQVVIQGNYIEDAPNGNVPAIRGLKGRFVIKGNTIRTGATSAWAYVVRLGDDDPVNTSGVVEGNTIIGSAWTSSAFLVGPEVTLAHNIFESPPTGGSASRYGFAGSTVGTDGLLSSWIPGTDTWLPNQDADFVYAPSQSSKIKVLNAVPGKGTWQPGDRAENAGTTGPPGWVCTTGGTSDTIKSGVTASTTLNLAAITITAGLSKVFRYQWITVAGVSSATQLLTYDPATGIGTCFPHPNATVTSGAVAYSPPVWTATNNAATLSIASQATGDILFASSASAFARLAAGAAGTYLQGGPNPSWVDSVARFDAGNSSTALTVTRTAARQAQKITLSTDTPVITIDDTQIPSGGYLVTDFFQLTPGSRIPTFALTSAATINWVGGSPPTLTTTAGKADRIVWENEGTRITAWLALANF